MIAIAALGALLIGGPSREVAWLAGVALVAVACMGVLPVTALGALVAMVLFARRGMGKQADARSEEDGEIDALEALSLATTAGLSFSAAAQAAAESGPEVAGDIESNLRRMHAGLPADSGREAIDGAFAAARRSSATGTKLGPTLRAQLSEMRRARTERRRTAMARLPVKLLFPLVFLILPGFLLLAVVPTVVGGLSRLQL